MTIDALREAARRIEDRADLEYKIARWLRDEADRSESGGWPPEDAAVATASLILDTRGA